MKKFIALSILAALILVACQSDTDVASRNLSEAAEQFEIERRVVVLNGITDTYLLSIKGRCAIKADTLDVQLEVTCKYRYRVIFRPSTIIPDIDSELGS